MSKGFVKEDGQEEVPVVPPRAPLPAGVTNYVTPAGMSALLKEQGELIADKDGLRTSSESETRIATQVLNMKLRLLDARIASAVLVDPESSAGDQVRFGSTITLRAGDDTRLQTYQIVGVDEADVSQGKISFISPIAKAMLNSSVGDEASIKLPAGQRKLTLIAIAPRTSADHAE